jgi:hypothetical protein
MLPFKRIIGFKILNEFNPMVVRPGWSPGRGSTNEYHMEFRKMFGNCE